MTNVIAICSKVFRDVALVPAYDILTSFTTLFRYHNDRVERNASSSDIVTVEMTASDLQFYFIFKSIWSLLMALLIVLTAVYLVNSLYKVLFIPYERVKRLGSIG